MSVGTTIACCTRVRLLLKPTTSFIIVSELALTTGILIEELLNCVLDNIVIDVDVLLLGLALIREAVVRILQIICVK